MEENALEMENTRTLEKNSLSLHSFEIASHGAMGMKEGQTHTQRIWDQTDHALIKMYQ